MRRYVQMELPPCLVPRFPPHAHFVVIRLADGQGCGHVHRSPLAASRCQRRIARTEGIPPDGYAIKPRTVAW